MMLSGFAAQLPCDVPKTIGDCMACDKPRDCVNLLVQGLSPGECMAESTKTVQQLKGVRNPEERMVLSLYQTVLEGQCPVTKLNNETYYLPDALPNWAWALIILYIVYSLNRH